MKLTPLTSGNILDFEESYPASAALVQIGEPAVAQIARRFEVTPSELDRLVLLDTLIRIKGKEWVVTYLSEVVKRDEGRISKVKLGELQAWAKSR